MFSNEVALLRYRTEVHFSNICTSGVVYLVTLLRSKDCTFYFATYREMYRYSLAVMCSGTRDRCLNHEQADFVFFYKPVKLVRKFLQRFLRKLE